MGKEKRKSRARIEQPAFLPPSAEADSRISRNDWISHAVSGFVSNSKANRAIYRVILETLWPDGHGIPGPIIEGKTIREAIDQAKGKPYLDTFRRVRELQGDEGFLGIVKQGYRYQLIDLNVYAKKTPRTRLPDDQWKTVLDHYNNVCAACGSLSEENNFQQDHKVPRARGGADTITNWQPLCDSCNNTKSTACRGCKEDCGKCSWAYPEYYKPIKLSGSVLRALHAYAATHSIDANKLVTQLIAEKLSLE